MVSLEAASLLDSSACDLQGYLQTAIQVSSAFCFGWIAQGLPLYVADAGAVVPPWGSSADSLLVMFLLEQSVAEPGRLAL